MVSACPNKVQMTLNKVPTTPNTVHHHSKPTRDVYVVPGEFEVPKGHGKAAGAASHRISQ